MKNPIEKWFCCGITNISESGEGSSGKRRSSWFPHPSLYGYVLSIIMLFSPTLYGTGSGFVTLHDTVYNLFMMIKWAPSP